MTNEVLKKITQKAKAFDFEVSRNYHPQKRTPIVYQQEICSLSGYEDNFFLIHENVILESTIKDSSYEIFEFDKNGNYIGRCNLEDLPEDFFRNKKTIMLLK
jgi:hypothetical protein